MSIDDKLRTALNALDNNRQNTLTELADKLRASAEEQGVLVLPAKSIQVQVVFDDQAVSVDQLVSLVAAPGSQRLLVNEQVLRGSTLTDLQEQIRTRSTDPDTTRHILEDLRNRNGWTTRLEVVLIIDGVPHLWAQSAPWFAPLQEALAG